MSEADHICECRTRFIADVRGLALTLPDVDEEDELVNDELEHIIDGED